MLSKNGAYNKYDLEAARKLADFLPDRIFDAHMHPYDASFCPNSCSGGCFAMRPRSEFSHYLEDMKPLFGEKKEIRANMITNPDVTMADPSSGNRAAATSFLAELLDKYPLNVGEIMVSPHDTPEDIEAQLIHPRIRGLKCYHLLSDNKPTWHASIGDYLPESAWVAAEKHGLVITLHMVRDHALADPLNHEYIMTMAKRYPNAVLILAHAARSFASWTGLEYVEKLVPFDNIWFDFSAVCESPAMFQIMKKCGVERCMWGSDHPVSRLAGKAISIADSFYWIGERDLENFSGKTEFHSWLVGTENLMAVRQACLMLELGCDAVESLFYSNALKLFKLK